MAKPPIEYRHRPASSSGRTADFGSAKGGSNPSAGTNSGVAQLVELRSPKPSVAGSTPAAVAKFNPECPACQARKKQNSAAQAAFRARQKAAK